MWIYCPLMYFAKAKPTSPKIPLPSFDNPGAIWKTIRFLAIYGMHSQQELLGQPQTCLLAAPCLAPTSLSVSYYSSQHTTLLAFLPVQA